MKTLLFKETESDIKKAAEIIREGGLIAFPTETVYGLGADALNSEAVKKVYAAKGRPSDNPMIVHICQKEQIESLTPEITEDMRILMDNFWPGPMTMIVRRKPIIPDVTTGGLDTVGIRLPQNDTARKLIKYSGCCIAAPSANLSGKPSPTKAEHVKKDLTGRIDGIIEGGDSQVGIESTVIDMTGESPMILRPGGYTKEDFEKVLGKEVLLDPTLNKKPDDSKGNFKPKAPGMKYKHYAPDAEIIIFQGNADNVRQAIEEEQKNLETKGKKVKTIIFDYKREEDAAHRLFAELREADAEGADVILASALPEEGLGFSIMNRLMKSAGYNIKNV